MNLKEIYQLADKFASKIDKQYVYHIKSPDFNGKYIYSLSELEQQDPTTYKQSFKKYKGREEWINRSIPPLKCKAKDTVNLSTIDPIKLFTIMILLDIESIDDKEIFKIPISNLKNQEFVLFTYDKRLDYKYKKQTINSYRECMDIPLDTVDHYIQSKKDNESPLIFEYVPHILVKGKVDISNCEIIKFKEEDLEQFLSNP